MTVMDDSNILRQGCTHGEGAVWARGREAIFVPPPASARSLLFCSAMPAMKRRFRKQATPLSCIIHQVAISPEGSAASHKAVCAFYLSRGQCDPLPGWTHSAPSALPRSRTCVCACVCVKCCRTSLRECVSSCTTGFLRNMRKRGKTWRVCS